MCERRRARVRAACTSLGLVTLLGAPSVFAQVALDRYSAPPTPKDGLYLSRPVGLGHQRLAGLLTLDFADDPLVLELERGLVETESTRLVDAQLEGHARVAYGLFDRLVLSAGLDAALMMVGERYDDPGAGTTLAPADGAGLGDARFGARYVALGDDEALGALALELQSTLPLARGVNSDQQLSGERSVTLQPRLLGELRPGRFRITASTSLLVRENSRVLNAPLRDELGFGLGAAAELPGALRRFEALAELYGSTAIADAFAREATPLEALLGGRYRPDERWSFTLAGGTGVQRGLGSPDLRAIASVGFVGVADEDADGDQVRDADDRCPFDSEDLDGHDDGDGCPEQEDRDGDGVLDATDRCPTEAEDQDSVQDDDGCPDTDDDADDVPDPVDRCRDQAEDKDGFQDDDGCPDTDNDGDGVADADDACPLDAGNAGSRGCPQVLLQQDRIEIRERIEFERGGTEIAARSTPILQQIGALLEKHPEITRVAIEGHTDSSGALALNQSLSEQRAQSVAHWLVEHGIARERLSARGCAASRPLADDASEAGRQQNRRVELNVLEPSAGGTASSAGCREVPIR